MPEFDGSKWGGNNFGTRGGVITWSIVPAGAPGVNRAFGGSLSDETFSPSTIAPLAQIEQALNAAFARWSEVANIEFLQVRDDGAELRRGSSADIRIAFGQIDGSGGIVARAAHPGRFPGSGDILFDVDGALNKDPNAFATTATHEIGHTIGLDHVFDVDAVMNTPAGFDPTLRPDDILGARTIYGRQDGKFFLSDFGPNVRLTTPVADMEVIGTGADNRIVGVNVSETLIGAGGADVLSGQGGADRLIGGADQDRLFGGFGSDSLLGGAANDAMFGANGADRLFGGEEDDRAFGGAGDDLILGNAGADLLSGDGGADDLRGGAQNDSLRGGAGDDTLNGNAGADRMFGGDGQDVLLGGSRDDAMFGSNGRDTVSGQGGDDTVVGANGNDVLFGGDGDDLLRGGLGVDVLVGGRGDDTLLGGPQDVTDRFVFTENGGQDTIRFFGIGDDVLDFSRIAEVDGVDDLFISRQRVDDASVNIIIDAGTTSVVLENRPTDFALADDDFLF